MPIEMGGRHERGFCSKRTFAALFSTLLPSYCRHFQCSAQCPVAARAFSVGRICHSNDQTDAGGGGA
jgi:hypothetical protein